MRVEWHKRDWVETQVFTPDVPSRESILFCPGFPGLGGAMFEQRHAAALVDAGYDVHVIHHKGTRTTSALAPFSINNGQRLQAAWENGETHLGGGAAKAEELFIEPLIVLNAIAGQYDSVHIIGNSFGALTSLWSLTAPGVPVDKVKTLILLAGAQGVDDGTDTCVMRIWKPEFMQMPRIADQIEVLDTPGAIAALKNLYNTLPDRVAKGLPAHIALTYIVMEHDEILRPSDTDAFRAAIGGRGDVILDKDERGFPAYLLGAHETPNFRTNNFLKLIRG